VVDRNEGLDRTDRADPHARGRIGPVAPGTGLSAIARHREEKPPFEQVVADQGATVLRVCRAVLGPSEAEDAWSETFLSALRAYPALPADANLVAWLVTIAHRRSIDVTRSAARRPTPVAEIPEQAHIEDPAAFDGALAAAVAALPTRQRQCVAYHYLGGLRYAEIAALVGGSEAAARRAASDGLATLRDTYLIDEGEQ